jgi:hypothetical protein
MSIAQIMNELGNYSIEGSEALKMESPIIQESINDISLEYKLIMINNIKPGYLCSALDDIDAINKINKAMKG